MPRPAVNDPEAALERPGAAGQFTSTRGGALRVEPLRGARMAPNAASASPRRGVPARGGPRIRSVFSHLSHSFFFRLVPAMAPTYTESRGAAPRSPWPAQTVQLHTNSDRREWLTSKFCLVKPLQRASRQLSCSSRSGRVRLEIAICAARPISQRTRHHRPARRERYRRDSLNSSALASSALKRQSWPDGASRTRQWSIG